MLEFAEQTFFERRHTYFAPGARYIFIVISKIIWREKYLLPLSDYDHKMDVI